MSRICAFNAERVEAGFPFFARLQQLHLSSCLRRIWTSYINLKFVNSLFSTSFSGHFDLSLSHFVSRGKGEFSIFLTNTRSGNGFCSFFKLNKIIPFSLQCNISYVILLNEDSNGKSSLFARADHSRSGDQHHERIFYNYGFFNTAESSLIPSNYHYPYRAGILRKGDLMRICLSGGKSERSQEFYNRNKPLCLICRFIDYCFIASDCKYPVESTAESTEDIIIKVPGTDTESLAAIEV